MEKTRSNALKEYQGSGQERVREFAAAARKFLNASESHSIEICWIAAHTGFSLHDAADKEAKEACKVRTKSTSLTSLSLVKKMVLSVPQRLEVFQDHLVITTYSTDTHTTNKQTTTYLSAAFPGLPRRRGLCLFLLQTASSSGVLQISGSRLASRLVS